MDKMIATQDDPYGLWRKGDIADDLGWENPDDPVVRVLRLKGEIVTLSDLSRWYPYGSDDEFDPRRRFRVYAVADRKAPPNEIAGCEDYGGIGLMLVTLHQDGEFDGDDAIGIMDTEPRVRGQLGVWIINPYARGTND